MKQTRTAIIGAFAVFIAGIAVVTVIYRYSQVMPLPNPAGVRELTDAQKKLIETDASLSNWLLGLSYSTLVALLLLRLKNLGNDQMLHFLPLAALSLLAISTYGGFLVQDALVLVLSTGPIVLLYGPLVNVPLLVQFWTLVGALALLAAWLFGSRRNLVIAIVGALAFDLSATASVDVDGADCVTKWQESRKLPAGPEQTEQLRQFLAVVAKQVKTDDSEDCEASFAILDHLRLFARQRTNLRTSTAFYDFTTSVNKETTRPNLRRSDVIDKFVSWAQVWRAPSGTLEITSSTACDVTFNGDDVGTTPWIGRVRPGTHDVKCVKAGRVIYSVRAVVQEGKRSSFVISEAK